VLLLVALATSLVPVSAAAANGSVVLTAEPLMGRIVRPGAWTAIRVHLANDGPPITGELRVSGGQNGDSRYASAVELPTGARQDHVVYAQPKWFGPRLVVTLVSGSSTLAEQPIDVTAVDPSTPIVAVVAERPEGVVGDIRTGASPQFGEQARVVTLTPENLPPRVEAWSAIDRLVWQDTDTSRLSADQLSALRAWLAAGGRLVIVGGSTGITGLGSLPAEILPYRPTLTVDVPVSDLTPLLGTLPAEATAVPALAGILDRGSVLGRSGDHVIAAQAGFGQGMVTIVGVDPGLRWLAGTPTATALWRRLLPPATSGIINPLTIQDDSQLVTALNNLPAVDLPDIGVLFGLLLLYIVLIGPINYLVLRRLDRREWAWFTMPALVLVFAVGAYAMGIGLKGTDVIVNQIGLIRGAAGTDRGIGQFYVGVFSPTRATYDVRVGHAALLTNPVYLAQQNATGPALDVLLGDPSRLRDYQVGFNVLRAFRAEAEVSAPRVDTDLVYRDGRLSGSVTNRSGQTLEAVAVVYGSGVATIPTLAPDASVEVSLDVSRMMAMGPMLSERLFGPPTNEADRTAFTRRTVIDQLTYYSSTIGGQGASQQGPVILAWTRTPGLDVELGSDVKRVGDTLAVLPAPVRVVGPTVYPTSLIGHGVIETHANEAFDQGTAFSLSRGTMSIEFRPMGFGGDLDVSKLGIMLTTDSERPLTGLGQPLEPLPDADQPDQSDPVGDAIAQPNAPGDPGDGVDAALGAVGNQALVLPPGAAVDPPPDQGKPGMEPAAFDSLPELQLFDRVSGKWVEFRHAANGVEFTVGSPERYVDQSGAFRARFVNRDPSMTAWFAVSVQIAGTAQ
jgi:hypothetical protein